MLSGNRSGPRQESQCRIPSKGEPQGRNPRRKQSRPAALAANAPRRSETKSRVRIPRPPPRSSPPASQRELDPTFPRCSPVATPSRLTHPPEGYLPRRAHSTESHGSVSSGGHPGPPEVRATVPSGSESHRYAHPTSRPVQPSAHSPGFHEEPSPR